MSTVVRDCEKWIASHSLTHQMTIFTRNYLLAIDKESEAYNKKKGNIDFLTIIDNGIKLLERMCLQTTRKAHTKRFTCSV